MQVKKVLYANTVYVRPVVVAFVYGTFILIAMSVCFFTLVQLHHFTDFNETFHGNILRLDEGHWLLFTVTIAIHAGKAVSKSLLF